jgi:hypothetical protein
VQIDGRPAWCVRWQSPNRKASTYWYFALESEAILAQQRIQSWEEGSGSGDRGEYG